MPLGQIERLLDQASKSFVRPHHALDGRDGMDKADAAMASCGIFTESTLEHRSVDSVNVEGALRTVTVLVTISVRFTAPDGSSATVRALGQGTGDLLDATASAAEDALRGAMATMLDAAHNRLIGNRGSESGRSDVA